MLGYWEFVDGARARRRRAPRRACCRRSRRSSRSCSPAGLVKAVFATETLALGINMPARTRRARAAGKWNGETHADITPGEYTQLTGRAGRRGIDVEGHAVVAVAARARPARGRPAWPRPGPTRCAPASGRPTTWRSTSSRQVGRERGPRDPGDLVRPVPGRPGRRRAGAAGAHATRRRSTGYAEAMTCHLGRLHASTPRCADGSPTSRRSCPGRASASRRAEAVASLEKLRPGDVIRVPAGRRAGLRRRDRRATAAAGRAALGPTVAHRGPAGAPADAGRRPDPGGAARPGCRAQELQRRKPASRGATWPRPLRIAPCPHEPPPSRRAAGRRPAARTSGSPSCAAQLRAHPCHGCPDREDHARWAERWWRLRRETDGAASARSRGAPTRWPAPSTGSATCSPSWATCRRRHRGHRPRASGCAGSTPSGPAGRRVPARTGCGAGSTPPGSPRPSSALVYEPRRDEGELVAADAGRRRRATR